MKVARLLVVFAALLALGVCQSSLLTAQTVTGAPPSNDITPTEEGGAWGWLKKPSITMPKVSFPKMPADPLAPIKTSARKVSDGTKKAWEGTKEMFSFGGKKDEPAARMASSGEAPSVWERMFGGAEEKPAEGPATVNEWMKQPRVE